MFKAFFYFIYAAIFAAILPTFALAENFDYRFDVRLGLVKIGEMQVAVNNNGSSYSVGTLLRTTGVLGAVYDLRYEQISSGRIGVGGVLVPVWHTSISDERDDVSKFEIRYSGDRVSHVTFDPVKSVPEKVTSYRKTIDPGTLMYFLLRPVTSKRACTGEVELFDGQSLSHVQFVDVKRYNDGRVECNISYSGEGGKAGVALSALVFEPDTNGLMRIRKFDANTSIGTLTIKAR